MFRLSELRHPPPREFAVRTTSRFVAIAIMSVLVESVVVALPAHASSNSAVTASARHADLASARHASVKRPTSRAVRIYDVAHSMGSGGDVYRASLKARSVRRNARATFVVRQVVQGRVVASRKAVVATKRTWRTVRLSLRTRAYPGRIQVLAVRSTAPQLRVAVGALRVRTGWPCDPSLPRFPRSPSPRPLRPTRAGRHRPPHRPLRRRRRPRLPLRPRARLRRPGFPT